MRIGFRSLGIKIVGSVLKLNAVCQALPDLQAKLAFQNTRKLIATHLPNSFTVSIWEYKPRFIPSFILNS
jgi:hypothetical protein